MIESLNITDHSSFKKMEVVENLRTVLDPELQINVIDMGLIYDIEISDNPDIILINMTLSSSHCPMGEAILHSVKNCLENAYPNDQINVNLVWEPAWTFERISEEGRRLLGQ